MAAKVPRDDAVEDAVEQLGREDRLAGAAAAHEPEELRGVGLGTNEPRDDVAERYHQRACPGGAASLSCQSRREAVACSPFKKKGARS